MVERRLYVDMDGVLAKWNNKATLEEVATEGYFLHRELQENLLVALEMLSVEVEIYILSAAYEDGHSARDKRNWLQQKGIVFPAIFVPYGKNKKDYVKKSGFLLDDFSKNLFEWEDGKDFVGIKFRNEVNGSKGTWKGASVSYESSPESIVAEIKEVLKCYTI